MDLGSHVEHTEETVQYDWTAMSYDVSGAAGGTLQLRLATDQRRSVTYEGYYIDEVTVIADCDPQLPGGLVVGNVYDQNTVPAWSARRWPTRMASWPQPNLRQTTRLWPMVLPRILAHGATRDAKLFTATLPLYGTEMEIVEVQPLQAVAQDFDLPTGWLSASPSPLEVSQELGMTTTVPLTLTNNGDLATAFVLLESAGDVPWLSESPVSETVEALSTQRIDVTFDASQVDHLGRYFAELNVETKTPYEPLFVW